MKHELVRPDQGGMVPEDGFIYSTNVNGFVQTFDPPIPIKKGDYISINMEGEPVKIRITRKKSRFFGRSWRWVSFLRNWLPFGAK